MVYDCFTYESLCIWMLKIKWNGLLKEKRKEKKAMTKKKFMTTFLDLKKKKRENETDHSRW